MRLITSLAINEFRECLFDLRSADLIGTQLHSWLARSERKLALSSLSIANKKRREKSRPFLFTRDAIRTHDLPLRRRLLYPAELLGLGSRGLRQAFGLWGTCIIPHKIYVITKIFDCKMFYYFCLRYNLFRLVKRRIKRLC